MFRLRTFGAKHGKRAELERNASQPSAGLIWTDGLPDYRPQTLQMELQNPAREYRQSKYFASLYVPPLRDVPQTDSIGPGA
jgi:hypothetical protein